jgi:hypothetical protein
MRKSEMTKEQLQERSAITASLAAAGWSGPLEEESFAQNLWLDPEASMEYENDSMLLDLEYNAEKKSVYFTISAHTGESIQLVIEYGKKLDELLQTVIDFQDEISPNNYRQFLRRILKVCPSTRVDTGDETLELVDDEEE